MKKRNFRERPVAIRALVHSSTVLVAFDAIIRRIAQVMVFLGKLRSRHASSGSLVEVHIPDGQIEYVEASQHWADATSRHRVGRAWQAVVQALRRSFMVQEPSHMPLRAYVPVRVTNVRRTRP